VEDRTLRAVLVGKLREALLRRYSGMNGVLTS
jgi:hypothetical protein